MNSFHKLAFLLENFEVPSPAQQLLDRFLIGYPHDGKFHRFHDLEISACVHPNNAQANFGARAKEFGLSILSDPHDAVRDANAIVIVPAGPGAVASDELVSIALQAAPRGAVCFVHGVLASNLELARQQSRRAQSRNISLLAGTPTAVTWRLPEMDLPLGTTLVEALIVVQGRSLDAELNGLEGLLPIIERRRGGEKGVRNVRFLQGKEVWRAGDKGHWSWPLLAAAISRSDSPQGDPVKDGRTQDIVGLGLVPTLAREPRGWLLEHRDGLRSAILVLDGVVADLNFAVQARDRTIHSAQLYRPSPPTEHHFSRLAAVLEDFFRTGQAPWPLERNHLIAGVIETFTLPSARLTKGLKTPHLSIAYK